MSITVPSQWVWWVQAASKGTGIGYDIVACQINEESGFDPNAVSPAGAEGIAQFLPSTFASYSSGSPFNPNDALRAYIGFMNDLGRQFSGDIFQMLEAYNAGPGNLQAGAGYATAILDCAGAGTVTGHAQPQPGGLQLGGAPPPGNDDDWSGAINRGGTEVWYAGTNALAAGDAIRRI